MRSAAPTTPDASALPLASALLALEERVSARAFELISHNTKRESAEATAVWQASPGPAPSAGTAALVVFEGDVDLTTLVMRTQDLCGANSRRNQTVFVFLGRVRCDVFVTVPDALVLLCGGLEARRLACFDGADSAAYVWGALRAPTILSGCSGGIATLEEGCVLEAQRLCGYVDIADEDDPMERVAGQGVLVIEKFVELWPPAKSALKRADVWEVVLDQLDTGTMPF